MQIQCERLILRSHLLISPISGAPGCFEGTDDCVISTNVINSFFVLEQSGYFHSSTAHPSAPAHSSNFLHLSSVESLWNHAELWPHQLRTLNTQQCNLPAPLARSFSHRARPCPSRMCGISRAITTHVNRLLCSMMRRFMLISERRASSSLLFSSLGRVWRCDGMAS